MGTPIAISENEAKAVFCMYKVHELYQHYV